MKYTCSVCGHNTLKNYHMKIHVKDNHTYPPLIDPEIDYKHAKKMMSDIPVYWINLDRSSNRKDIMNDMFEKINIKHIRIVAYDGNIIDSYKEINCNSDITSYEIGCTFSHFKAIKTAYDSGENMITVMEDDMGIDFIDKWEKSLGEICESAPDDWEIVKLHSQQAGYMGDLIKISHIENFVSWNPESYGTCTYIINRKGMKKVIDLYYKDEKWIVNYENAVADTILYDSTITYDYTKPLFNPRMMKSTIKASHNTSDLLVYNTVRYYYDHDYAK